MHVIVNNGPHLSAARRMTRFQLFRANVLTFLATRIMRYVPRLIWPGQEVSVDIRLPSASAVHNAESSLREAGIHFDTGTWLVGDPSEARTWHLDAMEGPVKVIFKPRKPKHLSATPNLPNFVVIGGDKPAA